MKSVLTRKRSLLRVASQTAAETIATGPDPVAEVRAYQTAEGPVVLKVRTQSGIVGYGECNHLSSAELASTRQAVVGRAPSAYQALNSIAPSSVRGGLNIALLDIVGKSTKAPIYRVLGGATRNKARAIMRLNGDSDDALKEDLARQISAGFRAFLIPVPMPTARNQGSEFVRVAAARLKAMRAAAPSADFAFEGNGLLTPGDAASLAAEVEGMHPLWFDEPCPVSNLETIRKIAEETVVPLGFGRTISDPGTFQDLLRQGLVDLLRPDLLTHGISGVCRLSAMAETYYIAVAPWHTGGAIAQAAALHTAASIPNFFIAQATAGSSGVLKDGFFVLPNGPGLGIEVDEKTFAGKDIA
jgi:galactonate dehydratase